MAILFLVKKNCNRADGNGSEETGIMSRDNQVQIFPLFFINAFAAD